MFKNKNYNFHKRYNTLYDVTLNMNVTGFCVNCVLGHNDADLHTVFYSCAEHYSQAFVSFCGSTKLRWPKEVYVFIMCVYLLIEGASPSFVFSSSVGFPLL